MHKQIWRDESVKNVHYILAPKPWDEKAGEEGKGDETHVWWWDVNRERLAEERKNGVEVDGY